MRPSTSGLAAALLLLALSSCGADEPVTEPEAGAAVDVRGDHRLAKLLAPCSKSYHYDRDTGDALGILLDKLQNGNTEALRRAKDELVELGAPAVPEVVRLLNRNFDGKFGSAHVQNAIEVLGRISDPSAHDALIGALDHPRDVVRAGAVRALSLGSAQPEDFDRLLAHMAIERENTQKNVALALYAADPERAREVYLTWFEKGSFPGLWTTIASKMLELDPAPIERRCLELYAKVEPHIGMILAAGALGTGDSGPRGMINDYLLSPDPNGRLAAVSALISVGEIAELVDLANGDPDPVVRGALLEELGKLGPDQGLTPERITDELQRALSDPSNPVRALVYGILLDRRDPEAQARVLDQLDDGREALQELAGILPTHLAPDDPYVDQLLERLLEIDDAASHQPLSSRQAVLQTIGLLPDARAAAYLVELGGGTDEEILRQRAHWWCLLQASNTGLAGRRYLIEHLEDEADPLARLDLIWAASAQPDDLGRDFLMDFVQGDPDPYELLFAAERLVRMGPTHRVAPVLKRVTLRVEQDDVRTALQCLLWQAY